MTVAEELREWAMRDEYPDQNTLTQEAWNELDSRWDTSYHLRPDDWRTFALLVAEALESEEMKKQITLSLPRPAHIKVHTDSQGFQYWDEPFYSADQVEEIRRAAILAERERCAKECEEVATHGRYQMEIDHINAAFWNGYAAGADQCATDILEADHAD